MHVVFFCRSNSKPPFAYMIFLNSCLSLQNEEQTSGCETKQKHFCKEHWICFKASNHLNRLQGAMNTHGNLVTSCWDLSLDEICWMDMITDDIHSWHSSSLTQTIKGEELSNLNKQQADCWFVLCKSSMCCVTITTLLFHCSLQASGFSLTWLAYLRFSSQELKH